MQPSETLLRHQLKITDQNYMKSLERLLKNAPDRIKKHRGDTEPIKSMIRKRLAEIYKFIR